VVEDEFIVYQYIAKCARRMQAWWQRRGRRRGRAAHDSDDEAKGPRARPLLATAGVSAALHRHPDDDDNNDNDASDAAGALEPLPEDERRRIGLLVRPTDSDSEADRDENARL
jgi:hypothetical protein